MTKYIPAINTQTATDQEVFDFVSAYLLKQNKAAISEAGDCLYRGPEGTMCAVGCMIPDDHYTSALEGEGITGAGIKSVLYALGLSLHSRLLGKFQRVHDDSPPEKWLPQLHALAKSEWLSAAKLPPNTSTATL